MIFFHRFQKRRDKKAGHPSIKTPAIEGVISLAEFLSQTLVGNGIAKSCQQLPVVRNDVTVMQGDDRCPLCGQDISKSQPASSALSPLTDGQFVIVQLRNQPLHLGSIVPENS